MVFLFPIQANYNLLTDSFDCQYVGSFLPTLIPHVHRFWPVTLRLTHIFGPDSQWLGFTEDPMRALAYLFWLDVAMGTQVEQSKHTG